MKTRPIPSYGDKFTIKEFRELVKSYAIMNDDGDGYYSDGVSIFNDKPVNCKRISRKFTHVIWFNK